MPDSLAPFLNWGIGVCVVMAVIWLVRIKTKKLRAIVMAGAFGAFALLLYFVKQEASQLMIVGSGVLLFALLAIDATMRLAVKEDDQIEKSK